MNGRTWRMGAAVGIATFVVLGAAAAFAPGRPGPKPRPQPAAERRPPRSLAVTPPRRASRDCIRPSLSPTRSGSWAAIVNRSAVVYSRPGGGHPVGRFSHLGRNRYPTFFAILGTRGKGCHPTWLRVQLSVLPNGTTGWVRPWLVTMFPVRTRIAVDLSKRNLTLYRSGRRVFSARIGIGAAATPTPTGRFFVNERWRILDPGDPLGVAALGISAHSTVLPEWSADGPIALHGTNKPETVGEAASHGCLRLSNPDIRRLLALTLAGTPVTIRP